MSIMRQVQPFAHCRPHLPVQKLQQFGFRLPEDKSNDTFSAVDGSAIGTCAAVASQEHSLTSKVPLGGSRHGPSSFRMVRPVVPDRPTYRPAAHRGWSRKTKRLALP